MFSNKRNANLCTDAENCSHRSHFFFFFFTVLPAAIRRLDTLGNRPRCHCTRVQLARGTRLQREGDEVPRCTQQSDPENFSAKNHPVMSFSKFIAVSALLALNFWMDGWMGGWDRWIRNKTHDDERDNQQSADTLLPSLAQDAAAAIEIKMKKMQNCKEGSFGIWQNSCEILPRR